MKIAIIGTRGIPTKYGGFETFAEELLIWLVRNKISCTIYCDKDSYKENNYNGINSYFINTTKTKSPIKYYFLILKETLKKNQMILIRKCRGFVHLAEIIVQ